MRHPLLAPDLRELVLEREEKVLRDFFVPHHPAATAEMLDDLAPEEALYVLTLLAGRVRAEVFSYLEAELQDGIAQLMDRGALATLVSAMSHDERADLITRLPEERTEQILPLLAQAEREDIRRLTAYKEDTAGAVMTSDYATVPAELTAAEAIDRLRHEAPDRETIYYCYVLDSERRLVGFVSLKNLILAPQHRRVADIMQREVISSVVDEDQEVTAGKLMEYDLLALPILDHENRLVGIVTHDDVADVIVEEATEDVYRLGAVGPLEDSYLRTPLVTMWGKRSFWLAILFCAEFMTMMVLLRYKETFDAVPGLVLFIPLIISAGGNCGSQSATIITRALALGEVRPADWFRIVWHEIMMGASLGLTLGALGLFGAIGFLHVLGGHDESVGEVTVAHMAMVVAMGVATVVVCGNLVGATLPLVLKRVGLDPALMSNPVVASLVDVTGILVYFAIAEAFLM
ncbi:MAG TPA: magnesium transporter [Pirellulales bacterium]|nr:magnesium transporter [Pirellulales bacterium]